MEIKFYFVLNKFIIKIYEKIKQKAIVERKEE